MPELDHLRKKPPDDGGLLLDTKDRRLKKECQECGVTFYIGPDETSQQTDNRRATLRRSINAAKTKIRRVGLKVGSGDDGDHEDEEEDKDQVGEQEETETKDDEGKSGKADDKEEKEDREEED